MTHRYRLMGAACLGAFAFMLQPEPAAADSVADFYKGKNIEMLIGYSSGGGYDRYARTIARFWGNKIPGNPDFVARNVPGAGSKRLMNEMYNTRPKDGTAVATVGRGIVQEQLFGGKGVKFDSSKVNWLGSANNEVSACVVWHETGINTLEDFLNRNIVVGGTGPGADTDTFPLILNNVVGTKLKLVTGYPGGNDINIAMERGEVQGRCGWSWSSVVSTRGQWLKEDKIRVMLQVALKKHPDLPDVPIIMDLAKNDRDRQMFELIFARQSMGRPYLAPPGVPEDRVAALRTAFMATMEADDFRKAADKSKLELNPVSGDEVQDMIAKMFRAPQDLIAAAAEASTNKTLTTIDKAVVPVVTVSGKITKIGRKGARVSWAGDVKKGRLRVGGNAKVMVAGKKAERADLQEGMACDFEVKGAETALAITCK